MFVAKVVDVGLVGSMSSECSEWGCQSEKVRIEEGAVQLPYKYYTVDRARLSLPWLVTVRSMVSPLAPPSVNQPPALLLSPCFLASPPRFSPFFFLFLFGNTIKAEVDDALLSLLHFKT
jgi:hypothetical protein